MSVAGPRTRFAPSPTGYLHLGHVASALHARECSLPDGRFLIRIEDIDPQRCRPEYARGLEEDLAWLGLRSMGPVRRQSEHLMSYRHGLDTLRARGLLYPCSCTRAEIEEASVRGEGRTAPDGGPVYPGTCRDPRRRVAGRAPVWRLNMARALDETGEPGWMEEGRGRIASDAGAFGDVVLGRRDSGVSYHWCVTHDDAVQDNDLITRGMDLYAATSVHRVLQCLMGWPEPRYDHHPLLLDAAGRKLSKRDNAAGIRLLREAGVPAREVVARARAAYSGG